MPRFPVDQWLVEQLRLTAFVARGQMPAPEERTWFRQLMNADPESRVQQPRTNALNEVAPFEVEGVAGGSRLLITSNPQRVDFRLLPAEIAAETIPDHISLTLPDGPRHLVAVFNRWVHLPAPPIVRLALGLVLLHQEPSMSDALRRLSDYLAAVVAIDPAASDDFSYQINRPLVGVLGERVNRLSKWAMISIRGVRAENDSLTMDAPGFAVRLELDLSTDAARTEPIAPARIADVVDELLRHSVVIATEGDRP